MRPMTCISCREEVKMAIVNRHLKPDRILILCPACSQHIERKPEWQEVSGGPLRKAVACLGCDRKVKTLFFKRGLPTAMGFCYTCYDKLTRPHLWEECRRVGDDPFVYTPDTIRL